MKKNLIFLAFIAFVSILSWIVFFLLKDLRGFAPAFFSPKTNIAAVWRELQDVKNNQLGNSAIGDKLAATQLNLPAGFRISVFAKNLPGARVMVFDTRGNMWVSRSSQDVVTMLEINAGKVISQENVLTGLDNPHGLAIDPDDPLFMYIGEENKITKVRLYSNGGYEKIVDLPSGGGHSTRTLLFGSDKKLYVSIGSSCNVCVEKETRRAAIYSLNRDGSEFKPFATGLRNSVFMTINPLTNEIWATDMGRDLLGDDIPPEELNIIKERKNYGWPYCYGKQIHDSSFDPKGSKVEFCKSTESPQIEIPAHSAPLGLVFLKNPKLPVEYKNSLIVSYHGSWNRSVPTGYKVARHKFDEQGSYLGVEDFITGWLVNENAFGRPVDILEANDGKIFISDDKAGVIYVVEYVR